MNTAFFTVLRNTAVDRKAGVIRGVSVITEGPARGHDKWVDRGSLESVVRAASAYAGGLKVRADHGNGVLSALGYLRNLRIEGNRVRGDLHVLESEKEREKLFDMAERIPDTFGLSIAFSDVPETVNGRRCVRCVEIYSADLVDTPAANPAGLFRTGSAPAPLPGVSTRTGDAVLSAALAASQAHKGDRVSEMIVRQGAATFRARVAAKAATGLSLAAAVEFTVKDSPLAHQCYLRAGGGVL